LSIFANHTCQPQAQQQQNVPSYEPSLAVIDQNDGFQYALSAAPNVLYQRYKQYGQVCISICSPCVRNADTPKVRCPSMVFGIQRAH
jgi:hypothetical protein